MWPVPAAHGQPATPVPSARDVDTTESGGMFADSCAATAGNGSALVTECGLDVNFLSGAVQPFMALTGGWLPLLFWGVLAMCIYLKYRNYVYASVFAVVAFVGTGIWLPAQGQVYLFLALGTGLAAAVFTLIWRIPRDVG